MSRNSRSADEANRVSIAFENSHQVLLFIRFQLWCAAMCVSSLEKCFHATLFVTLWVVTIVMQNLTCVSLFFVDVRFQLTIPCYAYRDVQGKRANNPSFSPQ